MVSGCCVCFMLCVFSGVLQGCPVSATLFVIAMNIFLQRVHTLQLQSSIIRAAADDIGGVLQSIEHLIPLYDAVHLFQNISGLHANPPKCIMVPLGQRFKLSLVDSIRSWLIVHVPAWAGLTIRDWGKYLGFMLGLAGGGMMWVLAESKQHGLPVPRFCPFPCVLHPF
jgi:hypothetical protein